MLAEVIRFRCLFPVYVTHILRWSWTLSGILGMIFAARAIQSAWKDMWTIHERHINAEATTIVRGDMRRNVINFVVLLLFTISGVWAILGSPAICIVSTFGMAISIMVITASWLITLKLYLDGKDRDEALHKKGGEN